MSSNNFQLQNDPGFLLKLVALLVYKNSFITRVHAFVKPNFFPSKVQQGFVEVCLNYFKQYQEAPKELFFNELSKWMRERRVPKEEIPVYSKLFEDIQKCSLDGEAAVLKEVSTFAKKQALSLFVLKAASEVSAGNFTNLESDVREAMLVGEDFQDISFYVESVNDRIDRRFNQEEEGLDTTSTLITPLDEHIGGLRKKELGIIFGPPNSGKSLCLAHLGKAGLIQQRKTAIYTLEMSKNDYEDRLDASLSGVLYSKLPEYAKVVEKRLKRFQKSFGKHLVVREFPPKSLSVAGLREDLDRLAGAGFVPDMLIVDYGDLMSSSRAYSEKRHEVASIFEGLRAIACENSISVWSGSQANRGSMSKPVVTMEDMGEDFSKNQIADLILSICRTDVEEQEDRARLYIAKNRRGKARFAVPIHTDFKRMQFYVKSKDD